MKALLFGASGGLATSIADRYLERGGTVALVTRAARAQQVAAHFADALSGRRATLHTVPESYAAYQPDEPFDAYFFTQALFHPAALADMEDARIIDEIAVGLADPILLTRAILRASPPEPSRRVDFCFTGSTSSYAGFSRTSVYCAVKHGLAGFIRAMNEEYSATQTRFWLFSMGSMDTEMGANVPEQDRVSFLQAADVAVRIVDTVLHPSNMFEPEVLIRRRTILRTPA